VPIGLNCRVCSASDEVSETNKKLNQQSRRISLRVWLDRVDDLPRDPMEGLRCERSRPLAFLGVRRQLLTD
jgi:hypothetical protein